MFNHCKSDILLQIEGAWNEDGKGLNIWDVFTMPGSGHIDNDDDGKIACDSYHQYQEDVQASVSLERRM
jgi:beta-glucosidase/6-phospho-beta-glucosidase/beta-galactosidase